MQDFVIDAFAFCRNNEQSSGSLQVAELLRLSEDCANSEGVLEWSLAGGQNQYGHPELTLTVSGAVNLVCQRCLTPFAYEIDSESVLVLAKSEEDADEIEALLEDDEVDVVVGSKSLNVRDLIEDEALLAIPQSPRHAVCPDTSGNSVPKAETAPADGSKKESPFAVLKNWNGRT